MKIGGKRIGAGRKPKPLALVAIEGGAGHHPAAADRLPVAPVESVPMPAHLDADAERVWRELEPHALAAHTLTRATAGAFADLVRAIVLRERLLARIEADGWTHVKVTVDGAGQEHTELKKHPLVNDHRAWQQRVEAMLAKFCLAPFGKALYREDEQKPANPLERFLKHG